MCGKCVMLPTTPSMAMYKTLLGRTMLKRRSMYSKMATIISSSFFGAGLQGAQQLVYNLQLQVNSEENCMVTSEAERSKGIIKALFIFNTQLPSKSKNHQCLSRGLQTEGSQGTRPSSSSKILAMDGTCDHYLIIIGNGELPNYSAGHITSDQCKLCQRKMLCPISPSTVTIESLYSCYTML